MKLTFGDKSQDMSYLIKDNKFRMEMNAGGREAVMLTDPAAHKMYMMMPEQKMYMEFPTDKLNGNKSENMKKGDFTKTGETKVINGYKCEKWTYKSEEGNGDVWMTKDLGSFMLFSNPMGRGHSDQPQWVKDLANEGYFPMLVKMYDTSGKENGTMEVTSVDKKKLDSNLFEVPSDYKKLDMPMMHMPGGK